MESATDQLRRLLSDLRAETVEDGLLADAEAVTGVPEGVYGHRIDKALAVLERGVYLSNEEVEMTISALQDWANSVGDPSRGVPDRVIEMLFSKYERQTPVT